MKQCIAGLPSIPPAIGPYSSAVIAEGKFVFVSGVLPYDFERKSIVRGTLEEQTVLVLTALKQVVEASGGNLDQVVSCRVYLQQLTETNFKTMNTVYERFFGTSKPARTTIGCQLLNVDVEIDCVVQLE
jgi:2-iminobutanoate/2-iminopropanoate deaminase